MADPTVQDFVTLCYRKLAAELGIHWLALPPTKSGVAERVVEAVMIDPPKDSSFGEHKRVFLKCKFLAQQEAERAMEQAHGV